ncbi:MAG: amino acid ABC transporter substrate-binding protein [Burkholderiales bacterium]
MVRIALLVLAALIAAPTHAQAPTGRLKKIADARTITIAHRTDASPFSFVDANQQITGYTIDLCRKVAESIGRQLGVADLKVKYVPVTTQTRFDVVAKGGADMECGASTVSLSRMKLVDFSSYVFVDTTGLMAKAAAGYQSLADLEGKRIAVVAGTTNERAVNNNLKRRKMTATVVPMASRDEAFAALDAGTVDAFASDALLLIGGMIRAKDPKALTLLNDKLSYEPYAIALPRGDYPFRLAVNTALSQIYSGDDIDEIFSRWFASFGKPTPLAQAVFILGTIPE